MHFIKGALLGAMLGTTVAFMNHDTMNSMIKKGSKEIKKMKNKYEM